MALTSAYDNSEAQVCMTLAAIAYSSENQPGGIEAAIQSNLANTSFATAGNWQLVWVALTQDNQNLVYVSRNTTQPAQYAVSIRGTDWCFLANLMEDFQIYSQVSPGFGPSGVMAGNGAMMGLQDITALTAVPVGGSGSAVTFLDYLQGQYNAGGFDTFDVYVTGHSLGGCLASITFAWLVNMWNGVSKVNVKAYTFAAPTAGNAAFASYVTSLAGSGPYYYWSVVNPNDLAPAAWSDLANVLPSNRVVKITFKLLLELAAPISYIIGKLQNAGVTYAQPGAANTHTLTNTIDFSSTCGAPPVSTTSDYFCWVGSEHSGNTYLELLGATPTEIMNAMNCPPPSDNPPGDAQTMAITQQQIAAWKAANGG